MPRLFRKIKIVCKNGRGGGYDGMLDEWKGQYAEMKAEYDGASAAEQ